MNLKKRVLPLLAVLTLFVAGCETGGGEKGPGASGGAEVVDGTAGASDQGGAETSGAREQGEWTGNPLDNPDSLLSKRVIYFDFDQSDILPDYVDILRAHVAYLLDHPDVSLTLEGHADERGSREYNIGLGERRGNAVREFMLAEGVPPNQLSVVSYGEERPVALGHDEESWSLNRRVELVY
ncbi:MAG TPA: peptidoglycan-associated lipoprotein Pal [Chromatiaceae bacterium]|nr:peptidoglycan-associated lipoprotein Pal [Chromatiaceae bacterium]